MPDAFLTEAALSVPLSSSTSAHLLSTHSHLLRDSGKSLNVRQQRDYCGACGSIRKPEWTKVTEIKPKTRKHLATSVSKGATVYKCLRCHRRAVLPPKQAPHSLPSAQAVNIAASSTQDPTEAVAGPTRVTTDPKSGENQNSKKRAKARKQGGLQALLASKQQAQPSLDLLDFLQ